MWFHEIQITKFNSAMAQCSTETCICRICRRLPFYVKKETFRISVQGLTPRNGSALLVLESCLII